MFKSKLSLFGSRIPSVALALALTCGAQGATAATATVFLSTVDFVGDSGPNPSASHGDRDRTGTASVSGSDGKLRASAVSSASPGGGGLISSRTDVVADYLIVGAAPVTLSLFAVVTGAWVDSGGLSTAGLQSTLSLGGGGITSSDRFAFSSPPGAGFMSGIASETLTVMLANVLPGSTLRMSASLRADAFGSCTTSDCGRGAMDAANSMTVYLGAISDGASLVQVGGDAFTLQTPNGGGGGVPAPVPLPAGLVLLLSGLAALSGLRSFR